MTHSSPSSTALVWIWRASELMTPGSVIANADRISPLQQRFEPRSAFCSGVPTRSSTSMLPVSGAEQFRHSDARRFLPSSFAM